MGKVNIREEAGVRTLHLGSEWIQGAMRIARPWNLELEYTRDMMASLLLREGGGVAAGHPSAYPSRVLLIGLGAASLTKFLYRHYQDAKLTVVEIEPDVVAAARQFFKLPDDPQRLSIVIGDGADFVGSDNGRYDLVVVDGFDGQARSGLLTTLPFYRNCRARLSSHGIVAINLLSSSREYRSNVERIGEAFEGRAFPLPASGSGNIIVLAAAGEPVRISLEELREQARELRTRTGLNLLSAISRLEQADGCTGGVLNL